MELPEMRTPQAQSGTEAWAKGPRGLMGSLSPHGNRCNSTDLQLQKVQDLSWHTKPTITRQVLALMAQIFALQQSNRTPHPASSLPPLPGRKSA